MFIHACVLIALFTRTVNVTVFMSGNFDLFDVVCKQNHRSVLNLFLNGTINGNIDGTFKMAINSTADSSLTWTLSVN